MNGALTGCTVVLADDKHSTCTRISTCACKCRAGMLPVSLSLLNKNQSFLQSKYTGQSHDYYDVHCTRHGQDGIGVVINITGLIKGYAIDK